MVWRWKRGYPLLRSIAYILFVFGAAASFASWYHYDAIIGIPLSIVLFCIGVAIDKKD